MQCQECRSSACKVIESRLLLDGTRRRRWHCFDCANRWTTHGQDAGPAKARRKPKPRLHGSRTLTNAQAAEIMLSDLPIRELARVYDMTHQAITLIRAGRVYRDVYASLGLERHGCQSCKFWDTKCTFGFPEAGGTFSNECTLYEREY